MPNKRVYEIDAFSTLEEFYDEVNRKVIPNASWIFCVGDLECQMTNA
jgi:hypothetical protein